MTSSYDYEVMEDAKYIPLLVLNQIACVLSILGASCILYMTSKRIMNGTARIMQRILFSLSIANLFQNTANLVMPYMLPSYLGFPGASGNHATCSAVGFVALVGMKAGACYNAYLSTYYLFTVRNNWKEHDFTLCLQVVAHMIPIVFAISLDGAAAATESINPNSMLNNLCIYSAMPWGCYVQAENLECTRSSPELFAFFTRVGYPFIMMWSIWGFICTFLVWNYVRKTLNSSQAYSFERSMGRGRNSSTMTSNNSQISGASFDRSSIRSSVPAVQDISNQDKLLRQVRTQTILYSLVYLNSFFWVFMGVINMNVLTAAEVEEKKLSWGYYIWFLCLLFIGQLQGFFNFFVYTRVDYYVWREREPERPFYYIYRQILAGARIPDAPRPLSNSRDARRLTISASDLTPHKEEQEAAKDQEVLPSQKAEQPASFYHENR